jgi:Ca2+-binding RTX toxin-like protein
MPQHTEQLESRRLMSVAASVGAKVLYVYGDALANDIHVVSDGDYIAVTKKVGTVDLEIYRTLDSKVNGIKIYARGGDDRVEVDLGIDANVTLSGGSGADWLKAGGRECYVYGQGVPGGSEIDDDDNAADTLVVGSGLGCHLFGQGGNDRFYTTLPGYAFPLYNGIEELRGGAGADRFYIGRGNRFADVYGEAGNDIVYRDGSEDGVYHGGTGVDRIDLSGMGKGVYLQLDGHHASGSQAFVAQRWWIVNDDVESVVGTPYKDELYGNEADNLIYGGGGDDLIHAGGGRDSVSAGKGNDTVYGEGDDDQLYGESGNDSLVGGAGNDKLVGGAGGDLLNAKDGLGGDVLFGGNEDRTELAGLDYARVDVGGFFKDFIFDVETVL